jgi:LEA14-like dessication related protein
MKQKRHIFIVFSCFLLFFGCKDFQEVKVLGVQGFKVEKLSMAGIEAEVMISIKNPNNIGFTIYPSEFDIIIGGVNLGKARLYKRVKIEGSTEKAYPFKLKSDFKGLNLMELAGIVGGKLAGNIEVKGNLYAGKFLIKKKYPVDVKEKFNMPKFN